MRTPVIEIRNLHKHYADNHVLRDVSLSVTRGEVVSIIGPSGSGKSTLLSCINFLEQYDAGEVFVNGELVGYEYRNGTRVLAGERALNALRKKVGFVFQQFNLFPHLNVRRNITVSLVRIHGMDRGAADEVAMEHLAKVGLAHKADQYPSELSGGQQQRVAIARALAMTPAVLLLDEITSALDPELVGEVLQVIKDLADSGLTMLIVTHEMQFARDVSSRVVFMDEGNIVESGAPRDVFANPASERLRQFLARFNA